MDMQNSLAVKPFLIDGEWVLGSAGAHFDSVNPCNGQVVARVAEASAADVDRAVASARRALTAPGWGDLMAHQRAQKLRRFAEVIKENGETIARAQTADNGRLIAESRAMVAAAVDVCIYYASVCETFETSVIPNRGHYFSFNSFEPVGVVAAISPWNAPIWLEAMKLAPALAAGNTIVLKSSEVTPQVGLEFGRLALEAGFPAGVLNVVTGPVNPTGLALTTHPGIDMITFTGGVAAGKAIARSASERFIPTILELGGKSPNIIFEDADQDQALAGALCGIFSNAGQACIAGSRVFVQRSIYEQFVSRFVQATKDLVVGESYDAKAEVPALVGFHHRDRVESLVAKAREDGAEILCGGARMEGGMFDQGAFFQPTILAVPNNQANIAQTEIFGPVACVIPFDDETDLIEQANDTVFGLAAGIWTADYRRALRVGRRIKAGTIWINTYRFTTVNMPFGGYKESGLGRECGYEGIKPYMIEKSYYLNTDLNPFVWPLRVKPA